MALNGSPRKNWNTAQILQAALTAAQEQGAEVEMVNLYDLRYTGCRSCFACKGKNSPSFGRCAVGDELKPVLERILAADVALFGSPIYFGQVTAQLRALLERLWFPSLNYDKERTINYPRTTVCGMVYTMNVPQGEMYNELHQQLAGNMERMVGSTENFVVANTLQFDDYSKYVSSMFDAQAKKQHHDATFDSEKQRAAQWMLHLLSKAQG